MFHPRSRLQNDAARAEIQHKEFPIRSAIEIVNQSKTHDLKEELRSQPFYIAPTHQSGHNIALRVEIPNNDKMMGKETQSSDHIAQDIHKSIRLPLHARSNI